MTESKYFNKLKNYVFITVVALVVSMALLYASSVFRGDGAIVDTVRETKLFVLLFCFVQLLIFIFVDYQPRIQRIKTENINEIASHPATITVVSIILSILILYIRLEYRGDTDDFDTDDRIILFLLLYCAFQLLLSKFENHSLKGRIIQTENNMQKAIEETQSDFHDFRRNIHGVQSVKKYLATLNSVHRLARNSLPVDKGLEILSNATNELENIFKISDSTGGFAIPTPKVPDIYEFLSEGAKSIVLVEPEIPFKPVDQLYQADYTSLLSKLSMKKQIEVKFIFIIPPPKSTNNNSNADEIDNKLKQNCSVLNDIYEFPIKKILCNKTTFEGPYKKWATYSHLIFEYENGEAIACSVMPLYTPKNVREIAEQHKQNAENGDNEDASIDFGLSSNIFLIVTKIPDNRSNKTNLQKFLSFFKKDNLANLSNISDVIFKDE